MPDVITHLDSGLFLPFGTYKGPGWYKYTWDGFDGKKTNVKGPFGSWHQLLAADHLEHAVEHLFLGEKKYTPVELMAALKAGLAFVDGARQEKAEP